MARKRKKEATMAQETISIIYDTENGRMIVGAPMENQEAKDRTIRMLLSAIKIIVDFKPSVIQPAQSIPGNGKPSIPLKVTH